MVRFIVAALAVSSLALPAGAAEVSSERAKSDKTKRCETTQEIGSRLARKRVCMTEAEWRDMRARTRTDLDKAIAQRPLGGD